MNHVIISLLRDSEAVQILEKSKCDSNGLVASCNLYIYELKLNIGHKVTSFISKKFSCCVMCPFSGVWTQKGKKEKWKETQWKKKFNVWFNGYHFLLVFVNGCHFLF